MAAFGRGGDKTTWSAIGQLPTHLRHLPPAKNRAFLLRADFRFHLISGVREIQFLANPEAQQDHEVIKSDPWEAQLSARSASPQAP